VEKIAYIPVLAAAGAEILLPSRTASTGQAQEAPTIQNNSGLPQGSIARPVVGR
jgi:hypothetical protein